jgi:hypothetical protein
MKSKKIIILIAILFALATLAATFSAGVAIGYRKAKFSYAWGENYHRNFGGPREGFIREFSGDFIDPHGTFGQIISINDNLVAVKGPDNVEKIVLVKDDTSILSMKVPLKLTNLKTGDNIVVLGEPNVNGQIEAKFIRIMSTGTPGVRMMMPIPR